MFHAHLNGHLLLVGSIRSDSPRLPCREIMAKMGKMVFQESRENRVKLAQQDKSAPLETLELQ